MFRSLNSRLLLSYVVIILVCLTLVGVGLLVFVRTSPLWIRGTVLRLEAASHATMALLPREGSLSGLPTERVSALLTAVAEEMGARALLLDRAGSVTLDSERAWVGQDLSSVLPRRRLPLNFRASGTFTSPEGDRWIFAGNAVPAPAGGHQFLLFVAPQTRLLALAWFADNLLPPLVQAGLVALVLSALLALAVSHSVAAPLRRVANAVQAIGRGETGVRAPVSGPEEVHELARALNRMVDQVEASRQSQRDFVANVSHELRTPLTSIQGFSQALLDGTAAGPEATVRAAGIISEEAERMRRLVDELLTLARFDAGQVMLAQEPVELVPVLECCVEKLAPQADKAGVTVSLDIVQPLTVIGDADRLAQVFTNLLDNGVSHTPTGGRVTGILRRVPGALQAAVVITDTGEGIPPESLPRIFERFYQTDRSRRRSRGAGLGLAITREIVEAHGGTVDAESVVGLGSQFTVRLPLSGSEASPERA